MKVRDILQQIIADRDALDGKDPWDDDEITEDEITEIVKGLNKTKPWFDPSLWKSWIPKEIKCDCGGKKANTTCAYWCSTKKS